MAKRSNASRYHRRLGQKRRPRQKHPKTSMLKDATPSLGAPLKQKENSLPNSSPEESVEMSRKDQTRTYSYNVNDEDDYKGSVYGYEYGFDCGYGQPSKSTFRRPHDHLLDLAYYAKVCYDTEKGYQYLADAYNEHVRAADEAPLLPPPTKR